MARRPAAGFTLVELLVVITIIGLLAAIALPAIGTAREAARRAKCISNVRETANAVINYELKKEKYPPSFSNQPPATFPPPMPPQNMPPKWPWLPPVLPFLGEQGFYDSLLDDDNMTPEGPDLTQPANQRYLPIVNCPSDPKSKDLPHISYTPNMGQADNLMAMVRDAVVNGIFHDRWSPTDMAGNLTYQGVTIDQSAIKDGKQYTILITENINARYWIDVDDEFHTGVVWIPEDTNVSSDFTLNRGADDIGELAPPLLRHARPSSNHQGGFIVAFCDGQVQWLSEEVEYDVYRKIMCLDDSVGQHDIGSGPEPLNQSAMMPDPFDPSQLEP